MPMRWTADNDQLLLLLILKVHNFSVDSKLVAAAWPEGRGEKPTPRAITERLVKIRKEAGGDVQFSINSSQAKTSTASTPRKAKTPSSTPRKAATNGSKTATPASKKRKIKSEEISDDEDETSPTNKVSARELSELQTLKSTPSKVVKPAFKSSLSNGAALADLVSPHNSRVAAAPGLDFSMLGATPPLSPLPSDAMSFEFDNMLGFDAADPSINGNGVLNRMTPITSGINSFMRPTESPTPTPTRARSQRAASAAFYHNMHAALNAEADDDEDEEEEQEVLSLGDSDVSEYDGGDDEAV